MTRISFGLAIALLSATGALAACDAESTIDVDDASPESTAEASAELTDVEACADECEDNYAEDRLVCMRKGFKKPKYDSCPSGVSAQDPSKCAGLNELCGIPTPMCHPNNPGCIQLNQQCANTHGPGLAAVCEPQATEELESCVDECVPPASELYDGQACIVILVREDGTVIIRTGQYYAGYDICSGPNGGAQCSLGGCYANGA